MSRFRVRWSTGFKATRIRASQGGNTVTVYFNEPPVGNPDTGVTITVDSGGGPVAAAFTGAIDKNTIIYTLTTLVPFDYDDLIVWTYDEGTGFLFGGNSSKPLGGTVLRRKIPPAALSVWRTVTGDTWKTNTNGSWLVENK